MSFSNAVKDVVLNIYKTCDIENRIELEYRRIEFRFCDDIEEGVRDISNEWYIGMYEHLLNCLGNYYIITSEIQIFDEENEINKKLKDKKKWSIVNVQIDENQRLIRV